jgi:hypothetical protein
VEQKHNLRFGLVLGQLAVLKISAKEDIMVFSQGQVQEWRKHSQNATLKI